jgi:hypothetical protein
MWLFICLVCPNLSATNLAIFTHFIFICVCSLSRMWRTCVTCFKDNHILGQNVCPYLHVQHEQIISLPFHEDKLIRIHLVECNALRRFINGKVTMWYNFWINSGVLCGFQLTATFIALFIDSALIVVHNFFVFSIIYKTMLVWIQQKETILCQTSSVMMN